MSEQEKVEKSFSHYSRWYLDGKEPESFKRRYCELVVEDHDTDKQSALDQQFVEERYVACCAWLLEHS